LKIDQDTHTLSSGRIVISYENNKSFYNFFPKKEVTLGFKNYSKKEPKFKNNS
jgi:hypothetical protein